MINLIVLYFTKLEINTLLNNKVDNSAALALKAKSDATFAGTVSGITALVIRLGKVNITSDASKPISSLTQTALDLKSNISKYALLLHLIDGLS